MDLYFLDCADVSQVCAYIQTHRTENVKHVQVLVYRLYLNKTVKKFFNPNKK